MKAIALFCSLFLLSSLALSKDVTPKEKLGSLRVVIPDTSNLDIKLKRALDVRYFKFEYQSGNKTLAVEPGKTYEVSAGSGCLIMSNVKFNFRLKNCNLVIAEKSLKEYQMGAFIPTWNSEMFKVDFGIRPIIRIAQENEQPFWSLYPYPKSNSMNPLATADMDFASYIFPGQYLMDIAGHGYRMDFSVHAEHINTIDMTPDKDIRSSIVVNFLDAPPKFKFAQGNYVVLKWGKSKGSSKEYTLAPHQLFRFTNFGVNNTSASNPTINFYRLSKFNETNSLKVFPASAENNQLQIAVNEFEKVIQILPEETVSFDVVTLNINDYESGVKGTFDISRLVEDKLGLFEAFTIYPFAEGYGYFYNSTVRDTQASMHLLTDSSYLLDFYVTDDLGVQSKQDTIQIDL